MCIMLKQEGNVLQEPAAAMHQMFIWGCSIFSLVFGAVEPLLEKMSLLYPYPKISREVTFPRKSHFPGIQISQEVILLLYSCQKYP